MLVPELVEGKKRNYCFPRSGPRRRRAGRSGGNQRNSIPFDKLRDQQFVFNPNAIPFPSTSSGTNNSLSILMHFHTLRQAQGPTSFKVISKTNRTLRQAQG